MRSIVRKWAPALALAALALGCGSGRIKEDPILRMSAEEALTEGKRLMDEDKPQQAREYLTHAFEVAPNSPIGREALLLSADAFYQAGGEQNLIRAEARYRDFQNRFPTSDRGAYVLYQIANSLSQRVRKPDRDQTSTEKALAAYGDVVSLYPTSQYAEASREQIRALRQHLAEGEFLVGRFYYRAGLQVAAIARFEGLIERFPDYQEMDKAIYFLGDSFRKSQRWRKAVDSFERLRREHPDSEWLEKVPELDELRAKAAAVAEAAAEAEGARESGVEESEGAGEEGDGG